MPTTSTADRRVRLTSAGNVRTICCDTLKPADAENFFRNTTPTEAERENQVGADGETILHLLSKCKSCESVYRAELRAARAANGAELDGDGMDGHGIFTVPEMSIDEAFVADDLS